MHKRYMHIHISIYLRCNQKYQQTRAHILYAQRPIVLQFPTQACGSCPASLSTDILTGVK